MRPTPAELLQGVRDGLESGVAPAVTDPAVRAQVMLMIHVLGNVAEQWDAEVERSYAAIARCEAVLEQGAPVVAPYAPELAVRLASASRNRAVISSMGELVRRRTELAAALGELVVACEAAGAAHDEEVVSLRTEAYAAIAAVP